MMDASRTIVDVRLDNFAYAFLVEIFELLGIEVSLITLDQRRGHGQLFIAEFAG